MTVTAGGQDLRRAALAAGRRTSAVESLPAPVPQWRGRHRDGHGGPGLTASRSHGPATPGPGWHMTRKASWGRDTSSHGYWVPSPSHNNTSLRAPLTRKIAVKGQSLRVPGPTVTGRCRSIGAGGASRAAGDLTGSDRFESESAAPGLSPTSLSGSDQRDRLGLKEIAASEDIGGSGPGQRLPGPSEDNRRPRPRFARDRPASAARRRPSRSPAATNRPRAQTRTPPPCRPASRLAASDSDASPGGESDSEDGRDGPGEGDLACYSFSSPRATVAEILPRCVGAGEWGVWNHFQYSSLA